MTTKKRLTAPTIAKIRKTLGEHLKARSLAEQAKHHQDSYRDLLRDDFLATYGTEDEKGNRWIIFDEEDPVHAPDGTPIYAIEAQKKEPVRLDVEAAEALIREKGLERKCLTKVVTYEVNEDALLGIAFDDPDTVSDEELQALYTKGDVTYAFQTIKKPVDPASIS